MSLFPTDINLESIVVNTIDETKENPPEEVGRSFDFDFQTKKFLVNGGKIQECTTLKAIENWIELYIRTEPLLYKVYNQDFGVDLNDLVGYRLPRSFQISEIERRITTGILNFCPRAKEVKDWSFDRGHFKFTVVLDGGEEIYING